MWVIYYYAVVLMRSTNFRKRRRQRLAVVCSPHTGKRREISLRCITYYVTGKLRKRQRGAHRTPINYRTRTTSRTKQREKNRTNRVSKTGCCGRENKNKSVYSIAFYNFKTRVYIPIHKNRYTSDIDNSIIYILVCFII